MIKFDIEGGECDAIIGAKDILISNKPTIIMEVWGGKKGRLYSDNAVKELQRFGYKSYLIKDDGSVSECPIDDPISLIPDNSKDERDNFLFLSK